MFFEGWFCTFVGEQYGGGEDADDGEDSEYVVWGEVCCGDFEPGGWWNGGVDVAGEVVEQDGEPECDEADVEDVLQDVVLEELCGYLGKCGHA